MTHMTTVNATRSFGSGLAVTHLRPARAGVDLGAAWRQVMAQAEASTGPGPVAFFRTASVPARLLEELGIDVRVRYSPPGETILAPEERENGWRYASEVTMDI